MWLSDVSVKRPVLATVINALLVVFGIFAINSLTVREYPDIDPPFVSIRTNYPGASASIIETQITQIIEDRVAGIEGIRRIRSSSEDGESSISIEFDLSRDVDDAANDVRDRVSRALNNLPEQAEPPEVSKADSDASPVVWLTLTSDRLNGLELTDYAARYLEDRFSTVDGVAQIWLGGAQQYAMRVWLDRAALAARQLTVEDVETALETQNVERPAGRLESEQREFTMRTARPFQTPQDFRQMVVARGEDGFPIRLGDVARVELGPVEPRNVFRANGISALGIGVVRQSTANTLDVARGVRAMMEQVRADLPDGMALQVNYDSSVFIASSLTEVRATLIWAALAVIAVIWLFLGSWRATLVPAVTVPISLIASFIGLQLFGFSINILTLLAMVLAIGLVVDDAIVVVENIHRRLENGEPPLLAAFRGVREVGFAVIATTAVLVAVLAPIALLEGDIGRLFGEFSLALAGAVVCSSIVALTLAPVLAAQLLRPHRGVGGGFLGWLDRQFERLEHAYGRLLGWTLGRAWLSLAALALLLGGSALVFMQLPSELTPSEDRGGFFVRVAGPEGASLAYTLDIMADVESAVLDRERYPEVERALLRIPGFGSEEVNQATIVGTMSRWEARERSTEAVVRELDAQLADIPGARVFVNQRAGLGSSFGSPVDVVLGGPSYEVLAQWQRELLPVLASNPGLMRVDSDFKETKPQLRLQIDTVRAADLGVPVIGIAQALETFFGGRRVTTYLDRGEEYDVILQAPESARQDPSSLSDVYVRNARGALIPLSNLIRSEERAAAPEYERVDRMRTIGFSAELAPGYALGEALAWIERAIRDTLPETARISYSGESRDFVESSAALYFSFGMALLIVYLVLCAQFESFVHPMVILTTVPLAVFGALAGLLLTHMSLNIYSQIGIIMLVGLAAKNGILIVEFINQRRDAGVDFDVAVREASQVRLRPILMTSIATLAGAVPLILASGAGAEARRILGVVIFFGVAVATVMTLFVVPTLYDLLCRRTGSPGRHAAALTREQARIPDRLSAPSP